MKFEAGSLHLVIKPENDKDVYNLGRISTKFNCETQFNATVGEANSMECNALLVKYTELIEYLINDKQ
jgi:hypothetical protein